MKPCDCADMHTAMTKLNEQGVKYGDKGILLKVPNVILEVGPCTVVIPQKIFKRFAEWFLEDQEV